MTRVTRERVMQFCIVRNRTVDMQFQKTKFKLFVAL